MSLSPDAGRGLASIASESKQVDLRQQETIDMDGQADEATDPGYITPTPDLSDLPGFQIDDVVANQAGRLSRVQVVAVRNHVISVGLAAAFLLAWNIVVFATNGISLPWVIVCGFLGIVINRLCQTVSDMRDPKLAVIEGDVRTEEDDGIHLLHINGHELGLSSKAYEAIADGGPYRVFFLKGANLVVGGEVLPGWSPAGPPPAKKRFPFSIEIG
jgi:hypothetical protein